MDTTTDNILAGQLDQQNDSDSSEEGIDWKLMQWSSGINLDCCKELLVAYSEYFFQVWNCIISWISTLVWKQNSLLQNLDLCSILNLVQFLINRIQTELVLSSIEGPYLMVKSDNVSWLDYHAE